MRGEEGHVFDFSAKNGIDVQSGLNAHQVAEAIDRMGWEHFVKTLKRQSFKPLRVDKIINKD
jgi:hypothetical protein